MKILFNSFLICIILSTTFIKAQNTDYLKAEQFAFDANELLKKGEVIEASIMIDKSIDLYPTKAIFEYAKTSCRMSDVSSATLLIDKAINKIENYPSPTLIFKDPIGKYIDGKMVGELLEYDKFRVLYHFLFNALLINKNFGGLQKRTENITSRIANLEIKKNKGPFDLEFDAIENFKLGDAIAKKDYESAIKTINNKPLTATYTKEFRALRLSSIYLSMGDTTKAFELLKSIKDNTMLNAVYYTKFQLYAEKGMYDEALKNYKLVIETKSWKYVMNSDFYFLAKIDLSKKEYKNALINLDSAINHRITGMGDLGDAALMPRHLVYKLFGDAYVGNQQYEKAKDNYTIALLSNPDDEPTLQALARLDSIVGKETKLDKTAPIITLMNSGSTRNAKVSVIGPTLLIKGFASDISGIKEVKINDKIVYSQKEGSFWGEVSLIVGINKITISATDYAENKSEQIFQIESKVATSEITETAIEKVGKNYCLLIASQNYSDLKIPSLNHPIADAIKLKLVFKQNYDFNEENVITLFNPEKNDVMRQLLELTTKLLPEDNLIIFYAGHGIWVENEKKGYWLLTDAKVDEANTWLPNKSVLDLIAKIPSHHTLLISDACFSGSVFKTRGLSGANVALKEIDKKICRVAITSGIDTEVPDESVFLKYLLKALAENKEKYLTIQKLFVNQIIEAVMTESKTEPRYGTLELAGHVGGDFILSKK